MTGARVFRFCTSAERAALQARVCVAACAWTTDWFGEAAPPQASCDPVGREDLRMDGPSRWLHGAGASGAVWARCEQAVSLAAALFDADPDEIVGDGIAAAVGLQALSRLVEQIAAGATDAPTAVMEERAPTHLLEPGRCALRLCVDAGVPLTLLVELPPRELPPRRSLPMPSSVALAVHDRGVVLQAWLGDAEVELGALRTLAVGDVLRLDRKLAQGVELRVKDARLPCAAYPVALGGRVAVEVARR